MLVLAIFSSSADISSTYIYITSQKSAFESITFLGKSYLHRFGMSSYPKLRFYWLFQVGEMDVVKSQMLLPFPIRICKDLLPWMQRKQPIKNNLLQRLSLHRTFFFFFSWWSWSYLFQQWQSLKLCELESYYLKTSTAMLFLIEQRR